MNDDYQVKIGNLITQVTTAATSGADTSEPALEYALAVEERGKDTPVEIIDIDEMYLKVPTEEAKDKPDEERKDKDYLRGKRICGAPRSKENRNLRCCNVAGFGTLHLGFGRCKFHARDGNSLKMLAGLEKKGFALNVMELIELYPEMLGGEVLTNLNEEIVMARVLASINLGEGNLIDAAKSLELVGKLKVNKSKIEVDRLTIDKKSLTHFIKSLYKILEECLPNEYYSVAALALQKNLRMPINKELRQFMKANDVGSTPEAEVIESEQPIDITTEDNISTE